MNNAEIDQGVELNVKQVEKLSETPLYEIVKEEEIGPFKLPAYFRLLCLVEGDGKESGDTG